MVTPRTPSASSKRTISRVKWSEVTSIALIIRFMLALISRRRSLGTSLAKLMDFKSWSRTCMQISCWKVLLKALQVYLNIRKAIKYQYTGLFGVSFPYNQISQALVTLIRFATDYESVSELLAALFTSSVPSSKIRSIFGDCSNILIQVLLKDLFLICYIQNCR